MQIWLNASLVDDDTDPSGDCDCGHVPEIERDKRKKMRVWLDTSFIDEDDNQPDDCPDPRSSGGGTENDGWASSLLSSQAWDEQQLAGLVLQHAPLLHIQECTQDRWLVCSPAGTGRIAVLDTEAMHMLQYFTEPTTLAQVAQAAPHWEFAQLASMVTFFLNAGFVSSGQDTFAPVQGKPSQLTAWIHLTNACNLRCSYCYLEKTSEHMDNEIARKAVDAVFRSALKHNMRQVQLKYAGGEASLHMRNVLALHDYASQVAQETGIRLIAVLLSNGVVLSQRAIDALKERRIRVMISLDGLGEYHDSQRIFRNGGGSSRYVLRTIERLLASNLPPHISITVSRRNLAGLPELMAFILERDLSFSISYYRENHCSAHIRDLLFEEQQLIEAMKSVFRMIEQRLPRRSLLGNLLDRTDLSAAHSHTCGVGQNYLVIDQHGGIAKCQVDIHKTITTIAVDDPLQAIQNDRTGIQGLAVNQKKGCQTCEWRNWCTGGCPLLTYRATGRYDVQSPNCGIYKALFPEVVRLEALRLLRDTLPLTPATPVPQAVAEPRQRRSVLALLPVLPDSLRYRQVEPALCTEQ